MSNKTVKIAQGFALIEVMIAVFVLAVGILGAGAIQTIGLQANQGAYMRSQAMFLASDILDRIRANRVARNSYMGINTATDTTTDPGCYSLAAGCSAGNLAATDIVEWKSAVQSLPNGQGKIENTNAGDNVKITISWGETDWKAGGSRDDTTTTYVLTAAINPGDH